MKDLLKVRNVLRVAIYIRVSSQEQAKEGYSVGEQEKRLRSYCEAMGWEIYKVYIDPGYSGGDTNRPGLTTMIHDVKSGKVDKVVVYKLDRLSRSQKDTLILIEDIFLTNDVDFVSMSESFDTATPVGRAVLGLLAVFAQLERDQIRERMTMGKEARAKEGKWNGGAYVPIGYDYNATLDLLEVNDYEKLQILELVENFLSGTPLRAVEQEFKKKGYKQKNGDWDPKTMRRVLGSKVYCGYMFYKGNWYPAEHEHIFEEETHEKLVSILKRRAEQFKLTGSKPGLPTTYLGGLLYCKHCGGKFAKDRDKQRGGKPPVLKYICNSRSKRVKKMIKDPNCKNKRWNLIELDNIILGEIRKLSEDPAYVESIKNNKPKTDESNQIAILEKEIEKIDDQISRFMDLYGIGKFTIEQVQQKVDPLNETRNGLQREIDTLNAEAGNLTETEIADIIATIPDVLDYGDFDEVRSLIETLIRFIEIDNEIVTIHWKFA